MPTQQLDILIKFLIDEGAVTRAEEAMMLLERAGIRFNKELGRFQDTETNKMVSGTEAAKRMGEAYRVLADQVKPLSTAMVPIEGSEKALAVGADILATYKDLGLTTEEIAADMEGIAGSEFMRADTIEKSMNAAEGLNQMTLKQLMAHEGIKDVNDLNLDLGKQIATQSKLTGQSLESIAATHARGSTNSKETYGNILAAARAAKDLQKGTGGAADEAARLKEESRRASEQMKNFVGGFIGFQLMMTGMQMKKLGQSLMKPMQQFADYAGLGDDAANEWLWTQKKIEQSFIRVGRVMVDQMLPTMQKIAEIMEDVADFAEENPGVAKAVTFFAAGTAAIGSILMAIGGIWTGVFALKNLFNFIGYKIPGFVGGLTTLGKTIGSLIAKATVGLAGLGVAGAAATGVGLGLGVAAMLPEEVSYQHPVWGETTHKKVDFGELFAIAAYGAGKAVEAFGGEAHTAERWFLKAAIATGDWAKISGEATDELIKATEAAKGTFVVSQEMVDLYKKWYDDQLEADIEYQQERSAIVNEYNEEWIELHQEFSDQALQAEKEYLDARAELIESYELRAGRAQADFNRAVAESQADFQRSQAQSLADFRSSQSQIQSDLQRAEAQAYADYQRNRASLIAAYHTNEKRALQDYLHDRAEIEEDYQRQLERMARDNKRNEQDAIAANDALALVRERRRYADEKVEAAIAYNEKLADLDYEYQLERQRRAQDLQQRLADLDSAYQAEKAKRAQEAAQRQEDAEAEFLQEQAQRVYEHGLEMARKATEFQIEQARAAEDHQARLDRLKDEFDEEEEQRKLNFIKEKNQLTTQFQERLVKLQEQYNKETKQRTDNLKIQMKAMLGIQEWGYQGMINATQRYVDQLLAEAGRLKVSGAPELQRGGYVFGRGLYELAEEGKEYVLDNRTTTALESALGHLTHDKFLGLIQMMAHSRQNRDRVPIPRLALSMGSGGQSVSQEYHFHAGISASDRVWIKQMVVNQSQHLLRDALEI